MYKTVVLLTFSNLFMTYAWYGHLKDLSGRPLLLVILASWGIAFFSTPSRSLQTASATSSWTLAG